MVQKIVQKMVQSIFYPMPDITYIETSKQIKDISFLTMASNSAHKGTHKIQLLTYSCNVQIAVEVKLLLKSKRESDKKRDLVN